MFFPTTQFDAGTALTIVRNAQRGRVCSCKILGRGIFYDFMQFRMLDELGRGLMEAALTEEPHANPLQDSQPVAGQIRIRS
jgi:hypothetical protein